MSGTKHCAVPLICRLKAYTPLLLLSLIPSKVPPVAHQGSWIIYATICLCIFYSWIYRSMWMTFFLTCDWAISVFPTLGPLSLSIMETLLTTTSFLPYTLCHHFECHGTWTMTNCISFEKKTSIYHFTHAAAVAAVVSWYMTANLHRPMSIIQWQHGIEWPTLKSFLLGHCTPWPLSLQNVTCSWFLVATSSCFVQDWTVSRCPCWLVW